MSFAFLTQLLSWIFLMGQLECLFIALIVLSGFALNSDITGQIQRVCRILCSQT